MSVIHQSETLVRLVAQTEGIEETELGVKGKSGILQTIKGFPLRI